MTNWNSTKVLGEFFTKYNIQQPKDYILDVISCIDQDQFNFYTDDLGIIIKYGHDGSEATAFVSTVNDDKKWIQMKAEILWKRFEEIANE